MRRPRKLSGKSNPLRDLVAERNRAAELARDRRRQEALRQQLPSLIDERVGAQMDVLETKLVEDFREMGQRVVEQSTEAVAAQLDGRISQLEQISVRQTETIGFLRDSSEVSEQKISGVVNSVETKLNDAVPGFRLAPPGHLQQLLNSPADAALAPVRTRPAEDRSKRKPNIYCPKCTSTDVRRANRVGRIEGILRLFFIAPYRCRACRHKFYRF